MESRWNRYSEGEELPLENNEDVWVTVEYPSGKREVIATQWYGNEYKEFSRQWDDGEDGEAGHVIAWVRREIPTVYMGE